jgi:hypothetical protein
MSETSSLIASVVRVQTYPKVYDNAPPTLFYGKFLGKSMEDEEAEWRNA